MKLRILIADDHEVVREGVRALLVREPGWEICGTAANALAAVEITREQQPDVVVLDLAMPELSPLEAVRQLRHASSKTEIIIFTASSSERMIVDIFAAGARSYIRKSDPTAELVAAVRAAGQRKPYFTPRVSDVLFSRFGEVSIGTGKNRVATLTPREQEVARHLAEGASNKDVAATLKISVRTVETHRAALLRKLGLRSVADLVRYAIRNSIIEP